MLQELDLPATPRAAGLARAWVGRVLADLGRDDLVSSAELGVSELVTNAILHASPPVSVRVRGTVAHPRIEVADPSPVPPHLIEVGDDPDDLLSTFGRGLSLMALHSAAWGSVRDPALGKTVWFEPVDEPQEDLLVAGDVFDLTTDVAPPLDGVVTRIRLLGVPVALFVDMLQRFGDLLRELQLLALTRPDRYPLAAELAQLATPATTELYGAERAVLDDLYAAQAAGRPRVDLVYPAPEGRPEAMARLRVVLEGIDHFVAHEALLAEPLRPEERQVQAWFLDEVVAQSAGAAPEPWTAHLGG